MKNTATPFKDALKETTNPINDAMTITATPVNESRLLSMDPITPNKLPLQQLSIITQNVTSTPNPGAKIASFGGNTSAPALPSPLPFLASGLSSMSVPISPSPMVMGSGDAGAIHGKDNQGIQLNNSAASDAFSADGSFIDL